MWVLAIEKFHRVNRIVRPKREALAVAGALPGVRVDLERAPDAAGGEDDRPVLHADRALAFAAGEIGHMSIDLNGRSGPYGAKGVGELPMDGGAPAVVSAIEDALGARPVALLKSRDVFAVFDDTLTRLTEFPFTTTALRGLALAGYRRASDGGQVVAFWFNDAPPADANGAAGTAFYRFEGDGPGAFFSIQLIESKDVVAILETMIESDGNASVVAAATIRFFIQF